MPRWFLAAFLVLTQSGLENFGVYGTSLDREVFGDLGSGLVRREVQQAKSGHRGSVSQRRGRMNDWDIDICNEDFVVGEAAPNDNNGPNGAIKAGLCKAPDHKHINSLTGGEHECERAALAAGATMGHPFVTPRATNPQAGNVNKHPDGCYTKTATDGTVLYFYNDSPLDITHIEEGEAAVCRRDRYMRGKEDSNECSSSEYKILYNELMCTKAAKCLRYTDTGTEDLTFVVDKRQAEEHDDFPAGCFYHSAPLQHMAFYNPPKIAESGTTLEKPSDPKGHIICIAESVTVPPDPPAPPPAITPALAQAPAPAPSLDTSTDA